MTVLEKESAINGPPIIGGTYPTTASAYMHVIAGGRDFSVLAPVVTKALQDAGLSVRVDNGSLTIAGKHEAQLPQYRMDENIWRELVCQGYKQCHVSPIAVRNIYSGGQHGKGKARIYMYSGFTDGTQVIEPLFVAKGEGGDRLINIVRDFAQTNPFNTPDFDQIAQRLKEPLFESQSWAPLMADTRDLVGMARFTGQDLPDVTFFADSMVAMIAFDEGLKYLPIPNIDGKPRYVSTWSALIRR